MVGKVGGSFGRLRGFLVEVWAELQKTTWPSKKEVQGTTVVVIVAVFLTAIFLYVVDFFIDAGLRWVLETFGR
jgi:preprotein translocase subunit SecE